MDSYTFTERRSWISRIGGSLKGLIFGLILILVGIALLWWNEGRAVRTAKGLTEGAGVVQSVSASNSSSQSNGQLIHLTSRVNTSDVLMDPMFNIEVNALGLKRQVEMYQWVESSSSETDKKLGGAEETTTTYNYERQWSDKHISSDGFKVREGHINPSNLPIKSQTFLANSANAGNFQLSPSLISRLSGFQAYSFVPPKVVMNMTVERTYVDRDGKQQVAAYMGLGSQANPKVGDIRVVYDILHPAEYSIIAQNNNGRLEGYKTRSGTTLLMAHKGAKSAELMFERAQKSNTILTWILRMVGVLILYIAFLTLFKPLVVVADIVPIIGRVLGMGASMTSFILALIVAVIVIAIAWLFFRPLLSIALVALAGVIWFYMNRKAASEEEVGA